MKFWKEKLEFNKIQKKRLELLEELSPYRGPTDPRPILKKVKELDIKLNEIYKIIYKKEWIKCEK